VTNNLLTDSLSEPLDGLATATATISAGSGNLAIDALPDGAELLVSGTLQYFEKQGRPVRSVSSDRGQAAFVLNGKDAGRPWLHFPWDACNGATEWQIHLNGAVSSDITAQSGGGNVEVMLPDNAQELTASVRTGAGSVDVEIGHATMGSSTLTASSGAGNVTVCVPRGLAARIHASSGMGSVVVEPSFSQTDQHTFESPDYAAAANKVEITVKSGAGNVSVSTI